MKVYDILFVVPYEEDKRRLEPVLDPAKHFVVTMTDRNRWQGCRTRAVIVTDEMHFYARATSGEWIRWRNEVLPGVMTRLVDPNLSVVYL